jgi:hypothetical protein
LSERKNLHLTARIGISTRFRHWEFSITASDTLFMTQYFHKASSLLLGIAIGAAMSLPSARGGVPQPLGTVAYVQDLTVSEDTAYWNEWPDADPVAVPWRVQATANTNQVLPFIPTAVDHPAVANSNILEIEADATHVYYLDNRLAQPHIGRRSPSNFATSTLWSLAGRGMGTARNLTLDGDWVVWADTTGIYRGRKDRTGARETIRTFAPALSPASPGLELNANGGILWWLDRFAVAHYIRRLNVALGTEVALGPLPTSVALIQRDGGFLYFLLNGNTIYRVEESLAGMPTLVLTEALPISGFLPHNGFIYYGVSRGAGVGLKRLRLADGAVDVVAAVGGQASKLAQSGNNLYWHSVAEQRIYTLGIGGGGAAAVIGDLAIDAVEVTQGIQSLQAGEEMFLIRDKETWVRVFPTVASLTGADTVATSAVLHGEGAAGPLPGSPLRPLRPAVHVYRGMTHRTNVQNVGGPRPMRDVLWSSINFRLPVSWCQGTVTLRAEVNPADGAGGRVFPEANVANNSQIRVASFSQQRPIINLMCPGVRVSQLGVVQTSIYPLTDVPRITDRLLRFMPAAVVRMSPRPTLGGTYMWDTDVQGASLIEDLQQRYPLETYGWSGVASRNFYAALPPVGIPSTQGGSTIGMAPYNSLASWNTLLLGPDSPRNPDISTPGLGVVLAHELSHNMGLGHPGCTAAERAFPEWLDAAFPYPVTQFGPLGVSRFHWLDLIAGRVLAPNEASDLMTYCRPLVPSDYLWRKTFPKLTGQDWVPGTGNYSSGNFVQIAGKFSPSGTFQGFRPSRILDRSWLTPESLTEVWNTQLPHWQNSGRCRLAFLNATGTQLQELKFSLNEAHAMMSADTNNAPHSPVGEFFSLLVPEAIGTKKAQLFLDGSLVGEQIVSNSAPSVTILDPQAGTNADTSLTVKWLGNDPDGDSLHYDVQYSGDNGQTWSLIAHSIPNTSTTCQELRLLPGGNAARVRVIATDGWNTGSAISAAFTVPNRPPTAFISHPSPGQAFHVGDLISFTGFGSDPEDLDIPGSSLNWQLVQNSSVLGQGSSWDLPELPPGVYTAILTVFDSVQNSHQATLNFTVSDRARPLESAAIMPDFRASSLPGTNPKIRLAWDAWGTEFDVYTSPDLTKWLSLGLPVTSNENEISVEVPVSAQRMFFQLQRR